MESFYLTNGSYEKFSYGKHESQSMVQYERIFQHWVLLREEASIMTPKKYLVKQVHDEASGYDY
jgi:hypothetical protein